MDFSFILVLAGMVLSIVLFVYGVIFLVSVPKHLSKIARALQVIALSMNEDEYFEQFDEDE